MGAYTDPGSPSSTAPTLNQSVNDATAIYIGSTATDVRVVDVHINGTGPLGQGIEINDSAVNTLLERVEINGVGAATGAQSSGRIVVRVNSSVNTTIADCNLHDSYGYGVYAGDVSHLSVLGSQIVRIGALDHGIRIQPFGAPADGGIGPTFADKTYVAENNIQALDANSMFTSVTMRGEDQNWVVVNNTVNRNISPAPDNGYEVHHIRLGLIGRQRDARFSTHTTGYTGSVRDLSARHPAVRNNLIINADTCVNVQAESQLPVNWVDQIVISNNTCFLNPPAGVLNNYGVNFIFMIGTTGSLTAQNNIFWEGMTNNGSNFIGTDGLGTTTVDHNLMYAPNSGGLGTPDGFTGAGGVIADPMFMTTPADSEAAT